MTQMNTDKKIEMIHSTLFPFLSAFMFVIRG